MKRYIVLPESRTQKDKEIIKELSQNPRCSGLSPIAIEILYNRGFDTVEKIEKHLFSTLDDLYSAELMRDSDKFIEELVKAINNNEEITIYTDYDVDGVTSVTVGVLALRGLGIRVNYYANNRFDEGYGITVGGVNKMLKKYPNTKLIITTDNGIVAFDGIKEANRLGLKVLVTDHHEPSKDGLIPEALAVVDPKRKDCEYPFKELCGAGIIFKLMILLYEVLGKETKPLYDLLDIVALGTVADMVPLIGENRILVKEGLKYHRRDNRPAFKKLREKLEKSIIDEGTFGFTYGPILNALGRIDGSPEVGVELFLTEDTIKMDILVDSMVEINEKRKELTNIQQELADKMVLEYLEANDKKLPYVIVLSHESFHEGVIGLVAGRIKEKYNRPTFVLSPHTKEINGEKKIVYKGSGRSIEGLHLKKSLDKISDTMIGYGGHAMAGGVNILEENLDNFIKSINKVAEETLSDEDLIKKVRIDTILNSRTLTEKMIMDVDSLKPFGMGFVKPLYGFVASNCEAIYLKNKNNPDEPIHLKLMQDGKPLLAFNQVKRYEELGRPTSIKGIGTPSLNYFRDTTTAQMILDDFELGNRCLSKEVFVEDFEK